VPSATAAGVRREELDLDPFLGQRPQRQHRLKPGDASTGDEDAQRTVHGDTLA
jgi:hypothetical protein